MECFLVAGLGNPGKSYENTRHNIGFRCIDGFAKKHGISLKKRAKFQAEIASEKAGGHSVVLCKPLTFMNESGISIAETMRYYAIEIERVLIVVDDIALPVGKLRLRINSSSGGHNGLKSVEEELASERYARLRIGVGDREEGTLSEHVLGRFSPEEEKLLPQVLQRAIQAIEIWLDEGLTSAMNFINRSSTPSIGEEEC